MIKLIIPAVSVMITILQASTVLGEGWKDRFFKERVSRETQRREQEVDQLALAALMIKDGYYDRAEAVLNTVDETDETLDFVRLYTLHGLVAMWHNHHQIAEEHFISGIESGQEDPIINVYLAQAYFGQKKYEQTLRAIDKAGQVAADMPAIHTMRAQCHWFLDQKTRTFYVLDEAIRLFPGKKDFARQRVFYLLDMTLFQEALDSGLEYLAHGGKPEDYVALGEALRQTRQLSKALLVLEAALLRFPFSEQILIALGHVYLDRDQPLIAAQLFERASYNKNKYISEAAELYRRAGNFYRALLLNTRISDQKVKTRQRLGIFIEMGKFEEASFLEPRLSRLGLLDDDDIRYAMAYTFFKTGQYDQARKHIRRIQRADLFQAATELMKAMEMSGYQLVPAHTSF